MSNALDTLIDLARRNTDERARRLADSLRSESSDEKRLQLLLDYRGEYLVSYGRAQRAGLSALALVNFHRFLGKLDAAIEQQRAAVLTARATTALARTALSEAERRRKSLVTLRDRRAVAGRIREARAEQRQHDEISARIAVHGPLSKPGKR